MSITFSISLLPNFLIYLNNLHSPVFIKTADPAISYVTARDKGVFLRRGSHPYDLLARIRKQVDSGRHGASSSRSQRWTLKKPRASLASALPNIIWCGI